MAKTKASFSPSNSLLIYKYSPSPQPLERDYLDLPQQLYCHRRLQGPAYPIPFGFQDFFKINSIENSGIFISSFFSHSSLNTRISL